MNFENKWAVLSLISATSRDHMSRVLFTSFLQFLAAEECGFTGQRPGVNVCNVCMNVKQGVAGKEPQHSAILCWMNTGTKLEGSQKSKNKPESTETFSKAAASIKLCLFTVCLLCLIFRCKHSAG